MPQSKFRPARETVRTAAANRTPKNLQVPVEDSNYGMLLLFRDYQYRIPGTSENGRFASLDQSNVSDTIFLPLPENIQDSFTVRVQSFEQGGFQSILSGVLSDASSSGGMQLSTFQNAGIEAVRDALPSALTDGGEFYKMMAENLKSLFTAGDANLSSLDDFSSDAAFLIRRSIGGNLGRSIDAGTGTVINPKAALSFEGVQMKTHSFNWTISPKSPDESVNLKEVIKTINKNILPQYVQGEVTQSVMFRYPSMVDIFFVGLDGNYYYFFKTAMVQTFNVNYTPNGVSVLKGGRPAAVQMSMNLIESEIHTAEDYGAESFVFTSSSTTEASSTGTTGTGASVGPGSF